MYRRADAAPPADRRRRLLVGSALGAALLWVAVSTLRGIGFVDGHPGMYVNPSGFVGGLKPEWPPTMWWALVVAVGLVMSVPVVARTERRWVPPLVAVLTGAVWTTSLALTDGREGLSRALRHRSEYRVIVPGIDDPGSFLDTFVDEVDTYTIHVKGHPPGWPLVLWTLDRLGFGSVRAEVLVILACVALNAALMVLVVERLADRRAAAAVAPFVGIIPAAVFMTTNADVAFTTVVIATTLAAAVSATSRGRGAVVAAAAAGLGAGAALYLTYGAPLMLLAPALLVLRTRRAAPVIAAVAALVGVVAAFAAAGFWWFDGLEATRGFYAEGVASRRPYSFFVVANIAVALVAVGPATIAGVATLRDRRLWWIVGPGLAGLLLADLSGLSKAEVERIWLPFYALIAVAVADLCPTLRSTRVAMSAQLGLGLVIQAVLTTPW